jgi:endoglucanase
MKSKITVICLIIISVLLLFVTWSFRGTMVAGSAPQLHVSGNALVNASGNRIVLHGVDRSGTEFECILGKGIFAGPSNQASISAMKSWGINAVRIPLNEACWNGDKYVDPSYSGANYRAAIDAYVKLLNSNGIVAILDLHWSDGMYSGNSHGCLSAKAVCQKPMPDEAEAVPFWASVAANFNGNDSVIFDLFNEPYPDKALPTKTAAWECWLKGGASCSPGISYRVAGMQGLVDTVRATGANNVIMLGGLAYSNNLTEWLKYEPTDPDHNLVASWHSYSYNRCNNLQCWNSQITPVISTVPLIAGEIGERDCTDHYIDPLMAYLGSKSTSYLAWAWNAHFRCGLISSYAGTPTAKGEGYKSHLQSLGRLASAGVSAMRSSSRATGVREPGHADRLLIDQCLGVSDYLRQDGGVEQHLLQWLSPEDPGHARRTHLPTTRVEGPSLPGFERFKSVAGHSA